MKYAAQAKAYLEDANAKFKEVDPSSATILSARAAANASGSRANADLTKELLSVDSKLRSKTKMFTKDLDAKDFSYFQNSYLKLEGKATQNKELGSVRNAIYQAKKSNATSKATNTYKTATIRLAAAENLIMQNTRNEASYASSVTEARESAQLLSDVMTKINEEKSSKLSEKVALQLVAQDRKIGKLSTNIDSLQTNVGSLQQDLTSTKNEVDSMNTALTDKERELRSNEAKLALAATQVKFQEAMDAVRKDFSKDEAAVYQQGDKLIIRLKKINFSVGSAEVPSTAVPLLSKVESVIKNIDPSTVTVQGHTDSKGSESLNQKLSAERAESVAKMFKIKTSLSAEGVGEAEPLASNDTAEGRSLNRRVDIIITKTN